MAIEEIIPQNEGAGLSLEKVFADKKGLGKPLRGGLYGVGYANPPLGAVSEEALKVLVILRGGDDEDIPKSRQHENAEGIVDHGFVVDREKLFAGAEGEGIEPGARASC